MFNNVLFLDLEPWSAWSSVQNCPDPTDQCTLYCTVHLFRCFDTVLHLFRFGLSCGWFSCAILFWHCPLTGSLSSTVLLCPALSCPFLPCLTCPALSCPVLPCPVLSCPVLPCFPVLTCPALYCTVLTCTALSCLHPFLAYLVCPVLLCHESPCTQTWVEVYGVAPPVSQFPCLFPVLREKLKWGESVTTSTSSIFTSSSPIILRISFLFLVLLSSEITELLTSLFLSAEISENPVNIRIYFFLATFFVRYYFPYFVCCSEYFPSFWIIPLVIKFLKVSGPCNDWSPEKPGNKRPSPQLYSRDLMPQEKVRWFGDVSFLGSLRPALYFL